MEHASVSRSSWISWPLAFLLHGVFDDLKDEPALPVRFRNWNTRLTLKGTSPQRGSEGGSRRSPSPGESVTNGTSGKESVKSSRDVSPLNIVISGLGFTSSGTSSNTDVTSHNDKDQGNEKKDEEKKNEESPNLSRRSSRALRRSSAQIN